MWVGEGCGSQKARIPKEVDCGSLAHEVSEGNKTDSGMSVHILRPQVMLNSGAMD